MKEVIVVILIFSGFANSETPLCTNGWEAYENEKCFKVFDNAGLLAYDSAQQYCNQEEGNASLIFIHSAEEQNFISNFLFKTNSVVDAVWIGARNSSITSKFSWIDSSDLSYTNWAVDSPSNKTNHDCVQMMPDSSPQGKWIDEPCNKKNAVVCQKTQIWSLALIQKNIEEINRKLKNFTNPTPVSVGNAVPVGFVYIQLPKQPEPKELWPNLNWEHISSQYSGHFFRVEGGNAAEFGTSQLDAFQGHDHESPVFNESSYGFWYTFETYRSDWFVRIGRANFNHTPLSNGYNGIPRNASETRPVNYSVRVWKRIH